MSKNKIVPNNIYNMDCVEGMKSMPDKSVDLIIADPPYNLSKGGSWSWDSNNKLKGFGGDWAKVHAAWDDMTLGDYVSFTLAWLTEAKRILSPKGSMWIHGTYHNSGIINLCLQMLEVEMINEVVWYKRNSFPNLSGRRLTASHESIIWAHTGGPKKREYYFNYETTKTKNYPEDQLKNLGKQMRTVWDIPNNKNRSELSFGKHPTQKPLRLIDRMLDISANKDFLCLSPFSGSGTECVAFKRRGLRYIGFEVEKQYYDLSLQRLNDDKYLLETEQLPMDGIL